jgi:uncharacterized protein (UPF0276 family)
MSTTLQDFPELGFGLGLRIPHYAHIFEHWPAVDWFEIISENFMDTDGKARRNLARIAERYPIVMHGVALSIGTVDPLNSDYLQKLKRLIDVVQPAWVSDHLCWTGVAHKNSHDLLPVPYTEEALKHIVARIRQVQDYLGRPIVLENPSTYLEFQASHLSEAEFIAAMARESGCSLLLDINNVYVTCYNHRLDAQTYIDTLPLDRVVQIHLSGHRNMGTHIIDTHDDHVTDEVWALYRYAIAKAGRTINTMVEWDDKLPSWNVLYAELDKARLAAAEAPGMGWRPLTPTGQPVVKSASHTPLPLADLQHRLQNAILPTEHSSTNPADWIRSKQKFTPAEQLAVYANAYRYRLVDVTAEDYPILAHYLGRQAFDELIDAFVATVESTHFNIGRYAAQLPDFIQTHCAGDVFAHELAILENAIVQIADYPETPPLTPEHLVGMTADDLPAYVLEPRAALRLFAFAYPVNAYYQAVQDQQSPVAPALESTHLAVFRHDDVMWRMPLIADEYHLLRMLLDGVPIGAALDRVQRNLSLPDDTLAAQLSDWFSRWMRNGLLACPE